MRHAPLDASLKLCGVDMQTFQHMLDKYPELGVEYEARKAETALFFNRGMGKLIRDGNQAALNMYARTRDPRYRDRDATTDREVGKDKVDDMVRFGI